MDLHPRTHRRRLTTRNDRSGAWWSVYPSGAGARATLVTVSLRPCPSARLGCSSCGDVGARRRRRRSRERTPRLHRGRSSGGGVRRLRRRSRRQRRQRRHGPRRVRCSRSSRMTRDVVHAATKVPVTRSIVTGSSPWLNLPVAWPSARSAQRCRWTAPCNGVGLALSRNSARPQSGSLAPASRTRTEATAKRQAGSASLVSSALRSLSIASDSWARARMKSSRSTKWL